MATLGIISSHDIFVAGLRSLLGGAGHEVVFVCNITDELLVNAGALKPEILIFSQSPAQRDHFTTPSCGCNSFVKLQSWCYCWSIRRMPGKFPISTSMGLSSLVLT